MVITLNPLLRFYEVGDFCTLSSVHSMNRLFHDVVDFAMEHTGWYLAICIALGTVIRWYWVGQSVTRFFNPLAPVFM